MTRNIPSADQPFPDPALSEWLSLEVPTIAWCWRLSRRDGALLGLTTHDRDLIIDNLPYRAAPGMRPSAIESRDDLDNLSLDIEGAITSNAIRAVDIDAGRWDGAHLRLMLVDWSTPARQPLLLASGDLGEIERRGTVFVAELRGGLQALEKSVAPATSPSCRAMLGDRDCRVNLAAHSHRAKVLSLNGREAILAANPVSSLESRSLKAGSLAYGSVLWLEGPWAGLSSAILSHTLSDRGGSMVLAIVPPAVVPPSVIKFPLRVELVEGCDGQLATCRDRFANAINFRGEAHLPGNDLLTRYPGG